jgi:hypothetical protein
MLWRAVALLLAVLVSVHNAGGARTERDTARRRRVGRRLSTVDENAEDHAKTLLRRRQVRAVAV